MDFHERKMLGAEIEATLVMCFRPSFFNYIVADDYIHVCIASNVFRGLDVATRTSLVFSKLRAHDMIVLEQVPVVVETYTTTQVDDLLEMLM